MLTSRFGRTSLRVLALTGLLGLLAWSCNRGNTGGGNESASAGDPFVADGGAGATIELETPDELEVGELAGFKVRLLDPAGQGLQFVRIFCETEQGIAITEPSRNGVAFENTDANGQMSGQVGGLTPGSYLMECRASEGFNLIARQTIIIRGDIPPGFEGFPGAAGGNLGGGRLVEEPVIPGGSDPAIAAITVTDVTGVTTETPSLDLVPGGDCDPDPLVREDEPFGADIITITISNPLDEPVNVGNLVFSPADGSGVTSLVQPSGTQIAANSTKTFSAFLTEVAGLTKEWAGTPATISPGTYSIAVTTVLTGAETGDSFSLSDGFTVQAANFDNCP